MLPGRNHNRKWLGEFEAQQLLDRHFDFFALRCERDSRSDPGADARTYGRTLAAAGDRSDQCPDAGRVLDPRVLVLPVWFARTRMAGDRPEQPVDQKGLDIENRTGTFSTSSISRTEMLRIYGITAKDLEVIRAAGKKVLPHLDEHIEEFYGWLGTQPEHRIFFSDPERLANSSSATTG